jgi:hypothetical protein
MPHTKRFDFPGAPRDSRPWRNWHPYVAIPMMILGAFAVVAPDPFVLSFLTGGLATGQRGQMTQRDLHQNARRYDRTA